MTKTSADLILDRHRLDRALTASGLGEYEWDMIAQVFRISARTAAITGWPLEPRSTVDENPLFELLHPEDREDIRRTIADTLSLTGTFEAEFRLVRPEAEGAVWVRTTGVLIRDEADKPIAVCGFLRDISRERMIEDQRRTLMSELDHRVKNVLSAVQTLATQTSRRTTSLDSFMSTFAGRLKSMAAANELLTAARWRGAMRLAHRGRCWRCGCFMNLGLDKGLPQLRGRAGLALR
jgi:PAS domain S-box-containing protein